MMGEILTDYFSLKYWWGNIDKMPLFNNIVINALCTVPDVTWQTLYVPFLANHVNIDKWNYQNSSNLSKFPPSEFYVIWHLRGVYIYIFLDSIWPICMYVCVAVLLWKVILLRNKYCLMWPDPLSLA